MPTFDPTEIELVAPPPQPGGGPPPPTPPDGPKRPPPPGDEPKEPPEEPDDQDKDTPQPEIDLDQIAKEVEEKLASREELGSEEEVNKAREDADAKKPLKPSGPAGTPGTGAIGGMADVEQQVIAIKPKYNWKTLIKNLVTSVAPQTDVTYAKPSRRAVTGISMAAQTGAGALKPGEKTLDETRAKIVFVFDTSGSMAGQVPRVLSETRNLVKQLGKSTIDFGVVFYADGHRSFVVNLGQDWYSTVSDISAIGQPVVSGDRKKGYKAVFGMQSTGGTVFSQGMSNQLAELAAKGYNVMIFSDEDMLDSSNFANLKWLWQTHKPKTFFIGVNENTFQSACKLLGVVPRTFSHLS
jgi:hypothetical protein